MRTKHACLDLPELWGVCVYIFMHVYMCSQRLASSVCLSHFLLYIFNNFDFFHSIHLFIVCIYVYVVVCTCAGLCMWLGQRTACKNWFSASTMWDPRMKIGYQAFLPGRIFTHWVNRLGCKSSHMSSYQSEEEEDLTHRGSQWPWAQRQKLKWYGPTLGDHQPPPARSSYEVILL